MVRLKKKEDLIPDEVIEKSVGYSYKFITFDSIKKGFAEKYIEAFASFLQASSFQFTLLVSLPQFIGGFVQLFTTRFLKKFRSKKRLTFWLTIMQSLIWILILCLVFSNSSYITWIYILLISFYFVLTLLHNPLWNSWIMDLISDERRGKYLAIQSKIFNFVTLISFLGGGFILNRAVQTGTLVEWAFAGLFIIAIVSNFMGASFLRRTYEPTYAYVRPKTSISNFIKGMKSNSQGIIVLYLSLMSFSVFISAPFFTPYLLQTLKFNYLQFAVLMAAPFLMKIIFAKRMGKGIDRYGPKKILKLVSFLIVLNPLMWIFNQSFEWLLFSQIYGGITYGVYEVSALTFLINETDSKNRVSLFTYYNFFNGLFILLGALSSNLLMRVGPYSILFLNAFLWSGILRLLVLFIKFPSGVKEKDRYVPTSYKNISKEVLAMDAPKELFSKMISAKEIISTKILNRNDVVTKLGNGEMVKIKKKYPVITNIPARYKKKKEEAIKTKPKADYMVYVCNGCSAEFRRFIRSTTILKCPYCGQKSVFALRQDFSKKRSYGDK